jgi:hypothetical protein
MILQGNLLDGIINLCYTKNMKKIIAPIIALLATTMVFAGCGSSYGIPDGIYNTFVDGKAYDYPLEYKWVIKNNKAEYMYLHYIIIQENGKIYFEHKSENLNFRYSTDYNKKTKILTVYMSNSGNINGEIQTDSSTTEPFYFKKGGIF